VIPDDVAFRAKHVACRKVTVSYSSACLLVTGVHSKEQIQIFLHTSVVLWYFAFEDDRSKRFVARLCVSVCVRVRACEIPFAWTDLLPAVMWIFKSWGGVVGGLNDSDRSAQKREKCRVGPLLLPKHIYRPFLDLGSEQFTVHGRYIRLFWKAVHQHKWSVTYVWFIIQACSSPACILCLLFTRYFSASVKCPPFSHVTLLSQ
jgi:hypothetical protein